MLFCSALLIKLFLVEIIRSFLLIMHLFISLKND